MTYHAKDDPNGIHWGWTEIVDDEKEMERRQALVSSDRLFDERPPVVLDDGLRYCAEQLIFGMNLSMARSEWTRPSIVETHNLFVRYHKRLEGYETKLREAGVPETDIRFNLINMAHGACQAHRVHMLEWLKADLSRVRLDAYRANCAAGGNVPVPSDFPPGGGSEHAWEEGNELANIDRAASTAPTPPCAH